MSSLDYKIGYFCNISPYHCASSVAHTSPREMSRSKEVMNVVSIDRPKKEQIKEELKTTIEKLANLKSRDNQNPAVRNLFNWLVNPQRTGEEFHYVVDELASEVYYDTDQVMPSYVSEDDYCMYLYRIAAEALAVICPVLEGPWEKGAWSLLEKTSEEYCKDDYGVASWRLTSWILQVITNSDLCPNPELRLHLMALLSNMVDLKQWNGDQVIHAILTGLASVEVGHIYSQVYNPEVENQTGVAHVLSSLGWYGYLSKYDVRLFRQLTNVKASRCLAVLTDFRQPRAIDSPKLVEPIALDGLISLLKATSRCLQEISKSGGYYGAYTDEVDTAASVLCTLLSNFRYSCQTPRLVKLSASCIMNLLKLIFLIV